ncbi:hypothetical protein ACHAWT_000045 [Skeletonema menzelii]
MPPNEKRHADDPALARASKKSRAGDAVSETTTSSESITDVVSHLHKLLETKEKELKEREANFDRRVKSFESTHPSIGSDNDVIQLNVGGQTNIAVLRSTLTQFEDSMLAAKFSGRWDESLEKDRDGNIFMDEDPENFSMLLKFLRMRMKHPREGGGSVPQRHLPKPSYEFCSMLEYYNLMQGVYGHYWVGAKDTFTCEEIAYGTVSLCSMTSESSDDSAPKMATVAYPHRSLLCEYGSELKLTEFIVEFEKGTTGAVGWITCTDMGDNTNITGQLKGSENSMYHNSMYLNIAERKAYGWKSILSENLRMNHTEEATKLVCRRSGGTHQQRKYSIELADGTKVDSILSDLDDGNDYRVLPMISFSGKVTVSGLKYAIDELY